MNADRMRQRFQAVLATTAGAETPTFGFWVGDTAEERRAADDLAAGRIEWHQARENAQRGLRILDADGDQELIGIYLEQAEGLARAALMRQLPANAIAALSTPARPRGRRPNADRDARLAAAVFAAEAEGYTGGSALRRAFEASPGLDRAIVDISDGQLWRIIRKHRPK